MPTTQISSKEELCALSRQLKSRLEASGRGRKAGLSAEFLQELLGALDQLAELASAASNLHIAATQETFPLEPAQAEPISVSEVVPAPAQPSISEIDLSRVVADAVASSLAAWQTQFATNIAQVIATNSHQDAVGQHDPDERTTISLELEKELSDTRRQLSAANDQLSECQLDLKRCRAQLEKAEHRIAEIEIAPLHTSGNDDDLSDQLKLQLEDTLNELADLREQNSDLATQLAHQVANSVTGSAGRGNDPQLTWEQRKLLILKQLESDVSTGTESRPHRDKIEIQEIIDASQLEIARRDEEIDELREIVRMQSDARAGVAIGAAGLAEILDSNELIQQERQKLQEIQQEWEGKLRQAEIDLSMERAKIARERIAIEKQKEELTQLQLNSPPPKEKTVENRWLRILGLNPTAAAPASDL